MPEAESPGGVNSCPAHAGTDVVTTRQAVWVANPNAGTVTQVDPAAMRVVRVLGLGGAPRSLATDGRTAWATVTGSGAAAQSNVKGVKPVGAANCESVVAGDGGGRTCS